MQGYNGSQLWDTTFAVQAVAATGLAPEFVACLRRAHAYVEATQARRALPCKPCSSAPTLAGPPCWGVPLLCARLWPRTLPSSARLDAALCLVVEK